MDDTVGRLNSAPTVVGMPTTTNTSAVKHQKNTQRFSSEEIAEARRNVKKAFELAGLVDDEGAAICPQCGRSGRNRLRFFPGGGYQCYSSDWCNAGDNLAVSILCDRGWKFGDAVAALLGLPHGNGAAASRPVSNDVNGFRATVDIEVYNKLVALGDVEAAINHYGRWHISASAIEELGMTSITDVKAMKAALLREFGKERLVEAGVVRPGDGDRRDYWVINRFYCHLEPHRNVDGNVVGLQARASVERERRIKKHQQYVTQRRAAEAQGVEFRPPELDETYVGKFSSLRGGQVGLHLVGGGIPRLARLPFGSTVYIVEGIKDLLAMRTLGCEAYALPGVGVAPSAEVIKMLARHNLYLCFDADDGGDQGTERLAETLARSGVVYNELGRTWQSTHRGLAPVDLAKAGLADLGITGADAVYPLRVVEGRLQHGLRCLRKRPPEGNDITDVLVNKFVANGCDCVTCATKRSGA